MDEFLDSFLSPAESQSVHSIDSTRDNDMSNKFSLERNQRMLEFDDFLSELDSNNASKSLVSSDPQSKNSIRSSNVLDSLRKSSVNRDEIILDAKHLINKISDETKLDLTHNQKRSLLYLSLFLRYKMNNDKKLFTTEKFDLVKYAQRHFNMPLLLMNMKVFDFSTPSPDTKEGLLLLKGEFNLFI